MEPVTPKIRFRRDGPVTMTRLSKEEIKEILAEVEERGLPVYCTDNGDVSLWTAFQLLRR